MSLEETPAVLELAELAKAQDARASSHWRSYHEGFRYENGRILGARGFGGAPPPSFWRGLWHRAMQRPYRRQGRGLASFSACDALAAEVARRQGRAYDLDILRQALTVAFVEQHLPAGWDDSPALVIGDGFGALSSLLLLRRPSLRLLVVNLTKTLLVDVIYIRRAVPEARLAFVRDRGTLETALASPSTRVVAVRADDASILGGFPLGAAFNVASMQEMNPSDTAAYFDLLRRTPNRDTWFYCCNREDKTLPDGTASRFADYPWLRDEEILADALCPWHQRWYSPRPPFYHPYDGPIRHRLARMAKASPRSEG